MTKDDKDRLTDFFAGFELVEYLQISTEDILYAFEDKIEAAMDDLDELMGVKRGP